MERYTVFSDRKNQYCENEYTTQAIYRCSAIPIKLPRAFFKRSRANNFTVCVETQNTLNSQNSPEKEEWSWMNQSA